MIYILFFLLCFLFFSIFSHYVYYYFTFYKKRIRVKHKYTVNIDNMIRNVIIDTDNEEYLIDSTIWYFKNNDINSNFFDEGSAYNIVGYGRNTSLFNLRKYIIDIK